MEVEDWKKRELESLYVSVFVLEEEAYVRETEKIYKQKIYIMMGINLKGYKEILGIYTPTEENTSYWIREFSNIKARGVKEIFVISILKNEWMKKGVKTNYPEVIFAPSMLEIYNKTCYYISRRHHRIIMREMGRIYRSGTREEAQVLYQKLIDEYHDNKLLMSIINKYIDEIFTMFQYSKKMRQITSNTDTYNKMRSRIRVRIKSNKVYNSIINLKESLMEIMMDEEDMWHPSKKEWDKIINEMDCNLQERIYELI